MRAGHGGGVGPVHGRSRIAVPALCVAVLCVGLSTAGLSKTDSVSLTAATVPTPTVTAPVPATPFPTTLVPTAPVTVAQSGTPPAEDVVTLPVGRQYVWPSGIGLVAAPPTVTAPSAPGGVVVVRVRTTVFNVSAAPYDLDAVLGPSARFGGHDVVPIMDSRFVAGAVEQVVPPGKRLDFETTFPAGAGPLSLLYRADFRFEAVEFEAPSITVQHP
jgi:hypothetical protein